MSMENKGKYIEKLNEQLDALIKEDAEITEKFTKGTKLTTKERKRHSDSI